MIAVAVYHETKVYAARDNPPIGCQLTGGQWNPLTGWNCS
jgi:hypothetical protein